MRNSYVENVSKVYDSAADRLSEKQDLVFDVYAKLSSKSLRYLDKENIKNRISRLLKNPLVEKALTEKGVAAEFRDFVDLNGLSEKANSELERVINGADFIPIWFLNRGSELRRTVARVLVRVNGISSYGTGFLIGPGVLITNCHVLDFTDVNGSPIKDNLAGVTVEFDYEETFDGSMQKSISFSLDPDSLLLQSAWHELDYVVVALQERSRDGAVTIDQLGYNRLAGDLGKIAKGEPVYIIQHPNGQPKQVVLQNNRLIDRSEDLPYLTYEADTDFGTSGSPVYNRQWEVVALHHSSEIARDGLKNILAKDGSVWAPAMGSKSVKFLQLNEGIRISKILSNLSQKYSDFYRQIRKSGDQGEIYTSRGLGLLEITLRTHNGAQPVDLIAPIPIAKLNPTPKFSNPD